MKNTKKLLALLLALAMVFALAACGNQTQAPAEQPAAEEPAPADAPAEAPAEEPAEAPAEEPAAEEPAGYQPTGAQLVAGKEYGVDYTSLYEQFGKEASIADVEEDASTGLAYLNVNGESYELGLDFLTMAMVYNTNPEGTSFETEDDVYAAWWKYYITRWNYLLPEIPLYSNEYYDVYNAKIIGVDEHPTNPFWGPARALIDWSSEKDDHSFILGNTTDLSGKLRLSTFAASSPSASDNDVSFMVNGLETVVTTKEGGYVVNPTVVKNLETVENEDGTATYTIEIYDDLVFSDGSPITAKNYLYGTMVWSSPVGTEAQGRDGKSLSTVGVNEFAAYDGTNEGEGVSKVFSGLRLLGDYTFSVTVSADYYPYFYALSYAAFSPDYKDLWLGADADIADDGEGVYFTGNFYEKDGDSFKLAKHIAESAYDNSTANYPFSGPYVVESYDASAKEATLKINPNFKGNYEGTKPQIETIIYKKIISETQLSDLLSGGVDCLAGITGGDETNEAIKAADDSNGGFVYTHYSRAGYGKLGFRADFGPVQFTEVRQAIAYCMDRATFAKDFTGGYGGVVDGPYYTGSWMYKAAVEQGMLLDAYDTSADSAIAVLEAGGWVYNAEGGEYTEGVRYKKIPGEYATENDKNFQSVDGAYKTVEIDGDYYMPLVLNWYGTVDNTFTVLLVTGFQEADNIKQAGFAVYNTTGDFAPMLDELYQQQVYGYYSGTPMYTCFNFATGFNSAVYDFAYNMTIDPSLYDDYSQYYYKDAADIYWLA